MATPLTARCTPCGEICGLWWVKNKKCVLDAISAMFFFFIIERWSANLQVLICTPYGVCVSACVFVCVCACLCSCLPACARACVCTRVFVRCSQAGLCVITGIVVSQYISLQLPQSSSRLNPSLLVVVPPLQYSRQALSTVSSKHTSPLHPA